MKAHSDTTINKKINRKRKGKEKKEGEAVRDLEILAGETGGQTCKLELGSRDATDGN